MTASNLLPLAPPAALICSMAVRASLDHVAVLGDRAAHRAGNGDLDGFGVGRSKGSEAGSGKHGGHGSGRETGQRHQELLDYVLVIRAESA
jgi:hypothetical protein